MITILLLILIPSKTEYTAVETPVEETVSEPLDVGTLIDFYAQKYEQSATLARAIIKAESGVYGNQAVYENKREDGSVWSTDSCLWQINSQYHDELAERMGWEYRTDVEDCIEMGFYIMKRDGSRPWKASSCEVKPWYENCWK